LLLSSFSKLSYNCSLILAVTVWCHLVSSPPPPKLVRLHPLYSPQPAGGAGEEPGLPPKFWPSTKAIAPSNLAPGHSMYIYICCSPISKFLAPPTGQILATGLPLYSPSDVTAYMLIAETFHYVERQNISVRTILWYICM
jgi:hypothetical protein